MAVIYIYRKISATKRSHIFVVCGVVLAFVLFLSFTSHDVIFFSSKSYLPTRSSSPSPKSSSSLNSKLSLSSSSTLSSSSGSILNSKSRSSLSSSSHIKNVSYNLPTHIKKPSYRIDNRDVDIWSLGPGLEDKLDDDYTYCKQVAPWQVSVCVFCVCFLWVFF